MWDFCNIYTIGGYELDNFLIFNGALTIWKFDGVHNSKLQSLLGGNLIYETTHYIWLEIF